MGAPVLNLPPGLFPFLTTTIPPKEQYNNNHKCFIMRRMLSAVFELIDWLVGRLASEEDRLRTWKGSGFGGGPVSEEDQLQRRTSFGGRPASEDGQLRRRTTSFGGRPASEEDRLRTWKGSGFGGGPVSEEDQLRRTTSFGERPASEDDRL
ncbi:hypothetical protein BJ508DRAFT_323155 [Ascobolus immersus RN42]|uniref:Uncharacterized protein n=1 Tax=Ascobolus immersus RN42 TaxID=1160509 RepID=A0A3N4IHS0_ASCIM|nr:hypothetical protein BJ508DRAFT_323155 [Ascobolus immersus RN42]